ncbi:MAG: hypothetical protein IPK72_19370 [Candidatus Eisenbacteria bacterium]|nr:hypothetical protein [Candidatus Eisenbacteria bacterium]
MVLEYWLTPELRDQRITDLNLDAGELLAVSTSDGIGIALTDDGVASEIAPNNDDGGLYFILGCWSAAAACDYFPAICDDPFAAEGTVIGEISSTEPSVPEMTSFLQIMGCLDKPEDGARITRWSGSGLSGGLTVEGNYDNKLNCKRACIDVAARIEAIGCVDGVLKWRLEGPHSGGTCEVFASAEDRTLRAAEWTRVYDLDVPPALDEARYELALRSAAPLATAALIVFRGDSGEALSTAEVPCKASAATPVTRLESTRPRVSGSTPPPGGVPAMVLSPTRATTSARETSIAPDCDDCADVVVYSRSSALAATAASHFAQYDTYDTPDGPWPLKVRQFVGDGTVSSVRSALGAVLSANIDWNDECDEDCGARTFPVWPGPTLVIVGAPSSQGVAMPLFPDDEYGTCQYLTPDVCRS